MDVKIAVEPVTIDFTEDLVDVSGTDELVYPGFSGPLRDKTKIEFDLSCNTPSTFGINHGSTIGGAKYLEQHLMVYYNQKTKTWDKVARGISGRDGLIHTSDILSSSAVGFSNTYLILRNIL